MWQLLFHTVQSRSRTRLPSANTLCAASRAMALAMVFGMGTPWGWGRILWGEGDRRGWKCGGSRLGPRIGGSGEGERSQGGPDRRPTSCSLVSGSLALTSVLDLGMVCRWKGVWGWGGGCVWGSMWGCDGGRAWTCGWGWLGGYVEG